MENDNNHDIKFGTLNKSYIPLTAVMSRESPAGEVNRSPRTDLLQSGPPRRAVIRTNQLLGQT